MLPSLNRRLDQFAETTSIQGIRETLHAKSLCGKLFWLTLAIITNGLTAYQIVIAVLQYMHQSSNSQIEVLEQGKLFYPSLKLCYQPWIQWVDFDKVESLDIDKPALLYALSYWEKIFVHDDFNLALAKSNFNEFISENNLSTITEFFESIAKEFPPGLLPSFDDDPPTFEIDYTEPNMMCYRADVNTFLTNGDFHPLSQFTFAAKENSKGQNMRMKLIFKSTATSNYTGNYVSVNEYKKYRKHILLSDSKIPAEQVDILLAQSMELFKNGYEYNFPSMFQVVGNNINTLPFYSEHKIKVQVNVHTFKNKKSSPCLPDQQSYPLNTDCYIKCLITSDEFPPCSCEIRYAKTLYSDGEFGTVCRYCMYTLSDNATCDQSLVYGMNDTGYRCNGESIVPLFSYCLEKCQTKGCQVWYLDTTEQLIALIGNKYFSENRTTTMTLMYPLENSIFVVKDVDSAQWHDIVSNIGGLLGIWMGASILSYVHLIYVLCDCSEPFAEKFATDKSEPIAQKKRKKLKNVIERFQVPSVANSNQ